MRVALLMLNCLKPSCYGRRERRRRVLGGREGGGGGRTRCTATHCNTQQQHTMAHYGLRHTAAHCGTLQRITTPCKRGSTWLRGRKHCCGNWLREIFEDTRKQKDRTCACKREEATEQESGSAIESAHTCTLKEKEGGWVLCCHTNKIINQYVTNPLESLKSVKKKRPFPRWFVLISDCNHHARAAPIIGIIWGYASSSTSSPGRRWRIYMRIYMRI